MSRYSPHSPAPRRARSGRQLAEDDRVVGGPARAAPERAARRVSRPLRRGGLGPRGGRGADARHRSLAHLVRDLGPPQVDPVQGVGGGVHPERRRALFRCDHCAD